MIRFLEKIYERQSAAILLFALALVPFGFFGAAKAIQSNVNRVEDWLPKSFAETHELSWFREHFPTDQFVIISWEGCQLDPTDTALPVYEDDPRINQLAEALRKAATQAPFDSYIKSVVTGRDMIAQLTSPPSNLPYEIAKKNLRGTFIGSDGSQSCIVVSFTPAASSHLKALLGLGKQRIFLPNIPPGIIRSAITECGIPPESVHMGGPPIDNISIDEEGERTLIRLSGGAALLGLILAWWSLRSIFLTGLVFCCAISSAALSLAVIWFNGDTVDAVVLSMPALVYVLAISESVHFINYYKEAVLEVGIEKAASVAVRHAFFPAFLCSLTTAFGLISLYVSDLVPIRKFGLYSSIGTMIILAEIFILLPTMLRVVRYGRRWIANRLAPDVHQHAPAAHSTNRFWESIGRFIVNNHVGVSFVSVCATVLIGGGLFFTRTSVNLLELFDSRAKIISDYKWLESKLGKLVPLEVVVRFPKDTTTDEQTNSSIDTTNENATSPVVNNRWPLSSLDKLEAVTEVQNQIQSEFGDNGQGVIGQCLSVASFMPPSPSRTGKTTDYIQRRAFSGRLDEIKEELRRSGFFQLDRKDGSELWRISFRVAAFQGVDYGTFIGELKDQIQPVVAAYQGRNDIFNSLNEDLVSSNTNGKRVILWEAKCPNPSDERRQKMMRQSLEALLKTARCKVGHETADANQLPMTAIERLSTADLVVMLGPFTQENRELITSLTSRVLDLTPVLQAHCSPGIKIDNDENIRIVYTGVVPIVYKAQRALLDSLIESSVWSFATIVPLMMLICRSGLAGAISMIPNILPVLAVFGGMGWLGIPIDIGSMMTASIALGIAVDDTIHFLSWFRSDLDRLKDRKAAIIATYSGCAVPTLQSAVISGFGLSIFALSSFTPTQRFGWLMLVILLAGVFAELVMLPAMLAGPLGAPFSKTWDQTRWWKRFIVRTEPAIEQVQTDDSDGAPVILKLPTHKSSKKRRSDTSHFG